MSEIEHLRHVNGDAAPGAPGNWTRGHASSHVRRCCRGHALRRVTGDEVPANKAALCRRSADSILQGLPGERVCSQAHSSADAMTASHARSGCATGGRSIIGASLQMRGDRTDTVHSNVVQKLQKLQIFDPEKFWRLRAQLSYPFGQAGAQPGRQSLLHESDFPHHRRCASHRRQDTGRPVALLSSPRAANDPGNAAGSLTALAVTARRVSDAEVR
jgi:hypothetical protein